MACAPDRPLARVPLRLQLELTGANLVELRLYRDDDEEPIAAASAEGPPGETSTYRFDLPGSPAAAREWRFRPVGAAADRLSDPRLRVVPRTRREDLAAAAVSRPWKFAFGDTWRTGALALPGHPVVWKLQAPPAASRLETAIAAAGAALDWRIVARSAAGSEVLASGSTPPPPPAGSAPSVVVWHRVSIALPDGGADAPELRFEVSSADPGAWGAWSEPLLLAPAKGPSAPDVVLVVLDTVRADRLTPYGAPADRTPFLARLARDRTALFEHAVTPATWTFPAHVSLMTGLEAFRHGAYSEDDARVLPTLPSLAVELRRAGYRTVAVTADGFVHPALGFATGFDRYSAFNFRSDAGHELERDVDRALAALEEFRGQPLFLFFHTYEAHVPNRARDLVRLPSRVDPATVEVEGRKGRPGPDSGFYGDPGFQIRDLRTGDSRLATPDDAPLVSALYDQALQHIDAEMSRLVAGLDAAGRWRSAMVVVTSDHGESLGGHGRMSHTWLDEANLRVPLLVGWPDRWAAGRRFPELVSLVDVYPTILAAAGIAPPRGIDGIPLRERLERGGSVRDVAWSYVAANNHGLALIRPDSRKLLFIDSAWRGAPRRVRLVDPRTDPDENGAPRADAPDLAKRAGSMLRESLEGEHVVVVNAASAAVRIRLRHPAIGPGSVKSPALEADLTWIRPGRAETRLAAGATGEWFLLGAPTGRVDLEAEIQIDGGGSGWWPVRIHLPAPRPDTVVEVAIDPRTGAWRRERATPGRVGLRLSWRGTAAPGGAPDEAAQELRRGLAALGYLE